MKTILEAINTLHEQFKASDLSYGHGSDNAWDEAVYLVLHCAGLPLESGDEVASQNLTPDQNSLIQTLAKRRIEERIPLPYLMKRAFFAGLEFEVDERVIVPRSPLAELILSDFQPWLNPSKVTRVLDLCCGSGCIGIAMAHYYPHVQVDLLDLSEDALAIATINVKKHGLEDRVRVIHSDLYQAIPNERYDLILTNPPYVDAQDMADIPDEYSHEPEMALASGADGLDATRIILNEASQHLNDNGILIGEVGNSAEALDKAFSDWALTWLDFEQGGDGVFLWKLTSSNPHV